MCCISISGCVANDVTMNMVIFGDCTELINYRLYHVSTTSKKTKKTSSNYICIIIQKKQKKKVTEQPTRPCACATFSFRTHPHTTEGEKKLLTRRREKIAKKNLNCCIHLVTEQIIINFHFISISTHKVVTRADHDRPLTAANRRTRHIRDRNSNCNSDLDSHGDVHNDAFPMAPDTADSLNSHVPRRSSR